MALSFENTSLEVEELGSITLIQNGILHCAGLPGLLLGEVVLVGPQKERALVESLLEDKALLSILGTVANIGEGDVVHRTCKIMHIPVGNEVLGRVINAMGDPIDGLSSIVSDTEYSIFRKAPQIMDRLALDAPARTGVAYIDILFPIARGQRELVLGDRMVGKTSLAVMAAIQQMREGSKCVYVIIGKEAGFVQKIKKSFENAGVWEQAVIVFASAGEAPALKVLSPFSGCTIGEYFMHRGEDVIIIYDDLSQHSLAHRQIQLALRNSPGREAYPGDLFFLHATLLERSTRVNADFILQQSEGGAYSGSLTALPILETQYGDITSLVATNLISITDGQIVLSRDLYRASIYPAVNIGASVSRIGGSAQPKLIKSLSAGVKITLSQYKELEAFIGISSDIDKQSQIKLINGKKTVMFLCQGLEERYTSQEMAVLLLVLKFRIFQDVDIDKMAKYKAFILREMHTHHKSLLRELDIDSTLSKDALERWKDILVSIQDEFNIWDKQE